MTPPLALTQRLVRLRLLGTLLATVENGEHPETTPMQHTDCPITPGPKPRPRERRSTPAFATNIWTRSAIRMWRTLG